MSVSSTKFSTEVNMERGEDVTSTAFPSQRYLVENVPRRYLLLQKTFSLTSGGEKRVEVGFHVDSNDEFTPLVTLVDDKEKTRVNFPESQYFLHMSGTHIILRDYLDVKKNTPNVGDHLIYHGIKIKYVDVFGVRGIEISETGDDEKDVIVLMGSTLKRFLQIRHMVNSYCNTLEKYRDQVNRMMCVYADKAYESLDDSFINIHPTPHQILDKIEWYDLEDVTLSHYLRTAKRFSEYWSEMDGSYTIVEITSLYKELICTMVYDKIKSLVPRRKKVCDSLDFECQQFMERRNLDVYNN